MPKSLRLNLLAVIIGIISGFGAWLFKKMTEWVFLFFIQIPTDWLTDVGLVSINWLAFLLSPILCGIIVGFLVSRVSREAKGHGIPEIMKSIINENGKMDLKVPFIKIIASAFTIGSGGSAGREGPIAQIGAGFGSLISQKLKLNPEEMKSIVISGVAAGISAVFNAPIGGVLFALEVIKRDMSLKDLSVLIIASVVGTVTGHLLWGNEFALSIHYILTGIHFKYLFYCLMLGVFAGIFSALWIKAFYKLESLQEKFFQKIKIPETFQPAIGGLFVGIILTLSFKFLGEKWLNFTIMGITYAPMNEILNGHLPEGSFWAILLILVGIYVLKLFATGMTIGSGGSGGVFAPTLFMGVFIGGIYGVICQELFHLPNESINLFALVGMASFFAGTVRAPFTAIIMSAEMTGDYYLAIPVMVGVVFSSLMAKKIQPDDIYILKLKKKGINISRRLSNVLDEIRVREYMIPLDKVISVSIDMVVGDVIELGNLYGYNGYPVLSQGQFVGVLRMKEILLLSEEKKKFYTVRDILSSSNNFTVVCVSPDITIMQAAAIMLYRNYSRLPVVEENLDQKGETKLVGWITRSTFEEAYSSKYPTITPKDIMKNTIVYDNSKFF